MTMMRDQRDEHSEARVLDVRPAAQFEKLHRRGAVNIPLDELAERIHELSPRDEPLVVYHGDATLARWARSRLRARDRTAVDEAHGDEWLRHGPVERGPSRQHLWRPHRLLIEAVQYARTFWPAMDGLRALDIACGSGRDAVYLALAGFDVDAWDVLPDALHRAEDLARRNGVCLTTQCRDVESDLSIAPAHYDLICCFNFLHRPLMPTIAASLRPGGLVAYETFVHPQRDLFGKPARDTHLLQPGELPKWFKGWEILVCREGLAGPRRFAASLIARRPVVAPG